MPHSRFGNQKGIAPILLVLAVVLTSIIAGGLFYFKSQSVSQRKTSLQPSPINSYSTTSSSATPESEYPDYISPDFEIDPLDDGDLLRLCSKGLKSFPASASAILKIVKFVDLSDNKLTKFPVNSKWQNIRELMLFNNNLSQDEQLNIRKQLPNTKISFTPQNDFNPAITDKWKTFSDPKYHFNFSYHPELQIKYEDNILRLRNDFAELKSAYGSCNSLNSYFGFDFAEKPNPKNLTPLQFINEDFGYGDTLITEEGNGGMMIGKIIPYKNNQIDGVIFDAGESEHYIIYAPHGNYMYKFEIWPGGETGSRIGDLPKKVFYNVLSTVKFN